MIALHKPQRATYDQAVEAQHEQQTYANTICIGTKAICWNDGPKVCC